MWIVKAFRHSWNALRKFWIAATCLHKEQEFLSNVYGDGATYWGCRSLYECKRCGAIVRSDKLNYGNLKKVE